MSKFRCNRCFNSWSPLLKHANNFDLTSSLDEMDLGGNVDQVDYGGNNYENKVASDSDDDDYDDEDDKKSS